MSSGCDYLSGVPVVAVAVWTGRGRAGLFIYTPPGEVVPRRERTGPPLGIEKGKTKTWSKQGASQKGRFFGPSVTQGTGDANSLKATL